MLKKKITYTDFDGIERSEDYYFNLTKFELVDLEMTTPGGFRYMIEKITAAKDNNSLYKFFKDIVLMSYGEKSDDGKKFTKIDKDGHRLSDDFAQTEAFSELMIDLLTDTKAAINFVNGIIPVDKDEIAQITTTN